MLHKFSKTTHKTNLLSPDFKNGISFALNYAYYENNFFYKNIIFVKRQVKSKN